MLNGSRMNAEPVADVGIARQHDFSDPALECVHTTEQMVKRQAFDLFVIGLLVVLAAASAQAQSTVAKADNPFGFAIGGTRLPAGEYTIVAGTPDVAPELPVFHDGGGRVHEVTMAARMEPGNSGEAKIWFLTELAERGTGV